MVLEWTRLGPPRLGILQWRPSARVLETARPPAMIFPVTLSSRSPSRHIIILPFSDILRLNSELYNAHGACKPNDGGYRECFFVQIRCRHSVATAGIALADPALQRVLSGQQTCKARKGSFIHSPIYILRLSIRTVRLTSVLPLVFAGERQVATIAMPNLYIDWSWVPVHCE